MNESTHPDPTTTEAGDSGRDESALGQPNGNLSPDKHTATAHEQQVKSSPPRPRSHGNDAASVVRSMQPPNGDAMVVSGEDGPDSEAETLIDSPVKKKDAEKQQRPAVKQERPPKHRIGSLPVPTDGDDENDSAAVSPVPSTVASVEKPASAEGVKDEDMARDDAESDEAGGSDDLSSARSSASNAPSRESSRSRAASERPNSTRHDAQSPNPRKRKHRASSVSLPNKRPSIDVPKRRLRGLHSEELTARMEQSPSPKLRSHRRAVSTQSGILDGIADAANRKRRSGTQGPEQKSRMSRTGWEESDNSSETTSQGQVDSRRPQRGIGRSTSTPGRPAGREHKRHVNKYGFTKLAEACEEGDLDLVKEWRERDPDQLELAEFAGNKPLQIAALNGNVEVVDYLIDQGCQIDCANVDKDTPLIDASENGHLSVVNSLLKAGVDPLRQNLKGQQALDVVNDENDDADDIRTALRNAIEAWNSNGAKQRREEEEELRHRAGPTKELHFMARSYENLLHLVQINDRNGVREFLDARVPVDNAVIAAAAKTGDSYLVNMLLVELPEKKRWQKAEKPLLSVIGTSHFEMVKSLTELENFNPLYLDRQGRTWAEIAEEKRGPNWPQEKELLQRLYDQQVVKERRSSSPVTKRDNGKRRLVHRAPEDDSEEENEAPRRKNGRKLMSRKEMMASRGKTTSDASSDEAVAAMATEAGEGGEESSMKPPGSPASKRTPTRARTRSLSGQPPEGTPRTRRRSSSFRAQTDQALPTLDESSEDREAAQKRREEEEEQKRVEEARQLEVQRREEEAAKAEAIAKEAAAAEAARQAEEERQAEEARLQEEMRKAEEARLAEELRKRKEEEMEAEKRAHREQIVASLPSSVSQFLSPTSGYDYNDAYSASHLVERVCPVQVLKHEPRTPFAPLEQSAGGTFWIVNVQAAPLLGEKGVELMLRSDVPGYQGSLAATWDTKDVLQDDITVIESILTSLPHEMPRTDDMDVDTLDGSPMCSFEAELQRLSDRLNSAREARQRLRTGEAILRYVRLDDVLKNLHPALKKTAIEVRFDFLEMPQPPKGQQDMENFIDKLSTFFGRRPLARACLGSDVVSMDASATAIGATPVTIMHEK